MTSTAIKILVAGDVEGNFSSLFHRVNIVNKKNGPFEMLLCVGNFFGNDEEEWNNYLDGTLIAPVPTYILGPTVKHYVKYFPTNNGTELCKNIIYLGQKGIFSTCSGLKIAYLSGKESKKDELKEVTFNIQDIRYLEETLLNQPKFKGVDILLTSEWPFGIEKYTESKLPANISSDSGSVFVADLAKSIMPRYHFCGLKGCFYERPPYRNHQVLQEQSKHVTRFISLAKVGNKTKEKWLYAFNIVPMSSLTHEEVTKQPQDVTENPYDVLSYSKSGSPSKKKEENIQYFYDVSSPPHKSEKKKRSSDSFGNQAKKANILHKQPPGPCWFCLGSPEVEKHLVVDIGTHIYLALAKGGLVSDHILILPIGHFQSIVELPNEAIEEIEKYKKHLQKFYKSKGKMAIFFERNYKTQHLQIQVVPVPKSLAVAHIRENFFNVADSQGIQLDEIPKHSDLCQIISPGCPYFYAELPDGQKFLHRIRGKFPLQFGREILASPSILNIPEKVDWKNCICSDEEESKNAKQFKLSYQSFIH